MKIELQQQLKTSLEIDLQNPKIVGRVFFMELDTNEAPLDILSIGEILDLNATNDSPNS